MAWFLSGLRFSGLAPRPVPAGKAGGETWSRRRPSGRARPFALALALLMAASMWFYVERVLIPYQRAEAAHYGRPRGNLSDLYPRWLGARELLLHRVDPYSPQVTREIQAGYYGRALDPARRYDPKDQQGFAYPVYVAFLLAPFLRLDFSLVRLGFTWVLAGLILATVLFWVKALRWHLSLSGKIVFILLVIGSFPAAQALKLQQLTVLVSAMLAAATAAIAAGWLSLAGLLLAISTIKPQLVLPLLVYLLIWVVGDWPRRWPLLASFTLTLASLWAAGEWVLPGWVGKFIAALAAYRQYTGEVSSLTMLLTPAGGVIATVALLGGLIILGWKLRRAPAPSRAFGLMTALVLSVTVVVIPTPSPYNLLLLLPAVIELIRDWRRLARAPAVTRVLYLLAAGLILWPWLATLYLSLASFLEAPVVAQRGWTLPLYTLLFIPIAVIALLGIEAVTRQLSPGA